MPMPSSFSEQYNRGANCCFALRDLLGCSADPNSPCRGFTGTCGDLAKQFAEVPFEETTGEDAEPMVVGDFECHEFPDPVRPARPHDPPRC